MSAMKAWRWGTICFDRERKVKEGDGLWHAISGHVLASINCEGCEVEDFNRVFNEQCLYVKFN